MVKKSARRTRRTHTPAFKARVALAALREDKTMAELRRMQTHFLLMSTRKYLVYGTDLHVSKGTRLWAPKAMKISSGVFIGKQVNIEVNCEIGDYCLIANRVAIVGRHDHNFSAVGHPMRYAPWIGSKRFPSPYLDDKVVLDADVWLGFGVTVLTGVTVGRGAVVAAGSVVVEDISPYSITGGCPHASSDNDLQMCKPSRAMRLQYAERCLYFLNVATTTA